MQHIPRRRRPTKRDSRAQSWVQQETHKSATKHAGRSTNHNLGRVAIKRPLFFKDPEVENEIRGKVENDIRLSPHAIGYFCVSVVSPGAGQYILRRMLEAGKDIISSEWNDVVTDLGQSYHGTLCGARILGETKYERHERSVAVLLDSDLNKNIRRDYAHVIKSLDAPVNRSNSTAHLTVARVTSDTQARLALEAIEEISFEGVEISLGPAYLVNGASRTHS